jgi:hypothetical protein
MDQKELEKWLRDLESAEQEKIITFESVSERAIDIALAVLLNSDEAFRNWLASQILGETTAGFVHLKARWGVSYGRESDLVWFVLINRRRTGLMFENTITCPPGESQCDDHYKRAAYWKKAGLLDSSKILLFSPRKYRSAEAEKYEMRLDYETVLDWLGRPTSEMRKELAWLLKKGIGKPQNAWNVDTDFELMKWFKWFWALKTDYYSDLWMIREPKSTGTSAWIEREFGRDCYRFRLMMKLGLNPKGFGWGGKAELSRIDLQIKNVASHSSFLISELRKLTSGSSLNPVRTGQSISIRREVPLVKGKDYDKARALEALKAAQQIQDWFEGNEPSLLKLLDSCKP